MNKKLIYAIPVLVLMLCANLISIDAATTNAKRDLNAARREYSKTFEQKDKLTRQISVWQKNYDEAVEQVIKNEDKPKSLPYKNAVKKCENLSAKISENTVAIAQLEHKMDSLNQVVIACEDALRTEIREKEERKQDVAFADQQESTNDNVDVEKQNSQSVDYADSPETTDSQPTPTTEETSEDGGSIWGVIIYVGIFILIIIVGWADIKRRFRCPKCGKWFTYESQGDRRVVDYDERGRIVRRGARKRHVCSNCGYERTFIEWFNK